MSKRKWTFRIKHILSAIEEIESYTSGMDFESFSGASLVQRACERCFEIIGEAAAGMPDDIKTQYPSVPWSKLKGMRNFLAHQYDEVLETTLWNTVKNDLQGLKQGLQKIDLTQLDE